MNIMPSLRKIHPGRLLVFLLLLLIGCDRKQEGDRIDFTYQKLQESTILDLASAYTIVKLETEENSRINFIQKTCIGNERIYVLNHLESRQEILEFTMDGTFLGKISSEGDQGRLSGISDFDLHPITGQLVLLDPEQSNLLLYDSDRKFQQKHPVAHGARELCFGMRGDKSYAVLHASPSMEEEDPGCEIYIYDEQIQLINRCLPYEEGLRSVFSNRSKLMKRKGKVLYLREGTGTMYAIGPKGCNRIAELDFPQPVLPLDKRYDALFSGKEDLSQYVFELDYFETNQTLLTAFSSTGGDFYGIYDKVADSSMLFNVSYDPDCFCSIKLNITGTSGEYFLVQIPRTKIKKVLEALDKDRSKCRNIEMFEVIEEMKPGENPILVLLELN